MMSRRRASELVCAVTVAAAALGATGTAQAAPGPRPRPSTASAPTVPASQAVTTTLSAPDPALSPASRYVVLVTATDSGVGGRVARVVRASRGSVVSLQDPLGTVVVTVTPATASALARLPGVVSVSADATARLQFPGVTASR